MKYQSGVRVAFSWGLYVFHRCERLFTFDNTWSSYWRETRVASNTSFKHGTSYYLSIVHLLVLSRLRSTMDLNAVFKHPPSELRVSFRPSPTQSSAHVMWVVFLFVSTHLGDLKISAPWLCIGYIDINISFIIWIFKSFNICQFFGGNGPCFRYLQVKSSAITARGSKAFITEVLRFPHSGMIVADTLPSLLHENVPENNYVLNNSVDSHLDKWGAKAEWGDISCHH